MENKKEKEIVLEKNIETPIENIETKDMNKKEKKVKKEKVKKYTFKRYFYGVGKEFERITWTPKKTLFSSFLVVVVVVTFFALIFTGVTLGVVAI